MSIVKVEFSRPVRVDQVPASGMDLEVTARPAEREALARRFRLRSIESLGATVRLKSIAGGALVRVSGTVSATVVQTCVVSLEPVPEEVRETFSLSFSTAQPDPVPGAEMELSFEDEDPPDPIVGGAIDVGEVVAEQLALALDPFPRKPGIAFAATAEDQEVAEKRPSPFAVLSELRKNKG